MSESKFLDKLCPVCRERFKEGDDIVVCPDCGTPHHRECWKALNRCGLSEFHGMNYVWNGRLPDEEEPIKTEEPAASPESDDPHHAEYPNGMPTTEAEYLESIDDPSMNDIVKAMKNNDRGKDGVSMRELVAYTATSIWHYTRAFARFREKEGSITSLNFCAALFSPYFQFFRRMDGWGVVRAILAILPSVASLKLSGGLTVAPSVNTFVIILWILNLLFDLFMFCFGDYLYYLHAVKKIIKIREKYEGDTESDEYFMTLFESGRPSLWRAALAMLAVMLVEACVGLL